jgi:hypothetical protein
VLEVVFVVVGCVVVVVVVCVVCGETAQGELMDTGKMTDRILVSHRFQLYQKLHYTLLLIERSYT